MLNVISVPAGEVTELCNEIHRLSKLSNLELDEIGARGREWLLSNRTYTKLADEYRNIFDS